MVNSNNCNIALFALLSVLLISDVCGQGPEQSQPFVGDAMFLACGADLTTADNIAGNQQTVYANLCNSIDGGTADNQPRVGAAAQTVDGAGDPSFTTLCTFLNNTLNVDIQDYLDGTASSQFTIFAPTDQAFAQADTLGLLPRENPMLRQVVGLHILPLPYFRENLDCGKTVTTKPFPATNGATLVPRQTTRTVCGSGGQMAQIGQGNLNKPMIGQPNNLFNYNQFESGGPPSITYPVQNDASDATVTKKFSSNVQSCNGIIHVVDQVILPRRSSTSRAGSKSMKKGGPPGPPGARQKSGKGYYRRDLEIEEEEEPTLDGKHSLEAFLEPDGKVEVDNGINDMDRRNRIESTLKGLVGE